MIFLAKMSDNDLNLGKNNFFPLFSSTPLNAIITIIKIKDVVKITVNIELIRLFFQDAESREPSHLDFFSKLLNGGFDEIFYFHISIFDERLFQQNFVREV